MFQCNASQMNSNRFPEGSRPLQILWYKEYHLSSPLPVVSNNTRLDNYSYKTILLAAEEGGSRTSLKGVYLRRYSGTHAQKGPAWSNALLSPTLNSKFLNKEPNICIFSLGPANYIAGPDWKYFQTKGILFCLNWLFFIDKKQGNGGSCCAQS